MPLNQIKEYVELCLQGDDTLKQRYDIIVKHRDVTEKQLEEAKKRVAYMNNKAEYYQELLKLNCDKMNPKDYSMSNKNYDVFISELND